MTCHALGIYDASLGMTSDTSVLYVSRCAGTSAPHQKADEQEKPKKQKSRLRGTRVTHSRRLGPFFNPFYKGPVLK